jgi:hypothetical protein
VSGFGQHTREARSYRAVCLYFVSCCRSRTTTSCPETGEHASFTGTSSNERGLAQSGRPRRAKWRREANRGGETAQSSSRRTGVARKGGVAGLPASSRWKTPRVVIAVFSSRGGRGKRSRPSWSPPSRERGEPTGEATGVSEVSRSKTIFEVTPRCGRENLLQGARADR